MAQFPNQKSNQMSDSKVIVTANKDGHVIVKSKNPSKDGKLYGHIRVQQTRMVIDDKTGFATEKKISALIPGEVNHLKGFGWSDGQEVDGKIRIVESTKPFNKKDPDKDIKIAGESGVVCQKDGDPIYRKHFFTFNMDLQDKLVEHTNDDEISAAYNEAEGSELPQSEDFNL